MMTRIYRWLLRLYPLGFRREYGEEMVGVFEERTAGAGTLGRAGILLGSVPETIVNAGLVHWEILKQDLAYTARTLRRSPGFAVTAVLLTALGVGANTAAFSVADFVLLRPLSFPEPETLVRLCEGPRTGGGWGCNNELSPANYRHFKEQTTSFRALGAFNGESVSLVGGGEPLRVSAMTVTQDVLPLLGVRPLLGRVFEARGVGSANSPATDARTVVLGYGIWQTRFGSDPGVVGRTVNLNGLAYTVIGVMPATFYFPDRQTQLWLPLEFTEDDYSNPSNTYLDGVGRLAEGVSFEQARADLERVLARLERDDPRQYENVGISFFWMRDNFSPRYRLMLQALVGASLCILVLACANLGNLLLARAAARERELAVRAALGAGRERLIRQLITEGITLALIGGVAGVLVSLLSFPLLSLMVPDTLPIGSQPGLNLRLLILAALFTAMTALGFGVMPALRAGGRPAMMALRDRRSIGGKERFRSILVAVEVGASVVLLVSSGLLIRALLRVQAVEPGFQTESVLTLRTELPKPQYLRPERREQFYRAVLTEVRRLPGVVSAAYTSGLPLVMTGGITQAVLPGQEVQPRGSYAVSRRYVTSQLFSTLGIPLISGRDLEDADADAAAQVAVVSESFAERYWPGQDPLGRVFMSLGAEKTVVGVVGDIKVRGLERTSEPQMYLPSSLIGENPLTFYDPKDLVIRLRGPATAVLPGVREIIRRVDPNQPISDVRTLSDVVALQTAPRRAQIQVLVALTAVALLLAGVGIHGLLAFTVAQRKQEIGVRLALGAEPRRIARRIVRDGLGVVLFGLIPGLFLALAAGRYLNALLFGVQPSDPTTIFVTLGLCVLVSITGAWIPAARAARLSPMSILRAE
jgi:predicted permease